MLFKTVKKFAALPLLFLLLLMLASCGGGGGSSSSSDRVEAPRVTGAAGTVAVQKTSLQFSENTSVTASLRNPDGTPAIGIPVTFTTSLGTLNRADGIAVTNSNGNASIGLNAGQISGKGQLLASATVGNRVVNLSTLFDVVLPPLTIQSIALTDNSSGEIDYGASQGVTVEIVDSNGDRFTAQGVPVVFSSPQVSNGTATISTPVTSVNGRATATYKAVTASGSDTITASIPGGASKSVTLKINPLRAGSISFVSALPATIALKGTGGGGVQGSSVLTFKVLDTTGDPMPNQAVTFALPTGVGGARLSADSGSTAADGTVSTTVWSGVVATPIVVTASTTVGTEVLSTQSNALVVATGVAAQDGFSVSLSDLNPESYNTDGVEVQVTARLSDHFHNPVPNGTAVYFTTSGGSIAPSCVTSGGACSVTWKSQNPRPAAANGAFADGRAVILAYTIGEEAFLDLNGNGLADPTDTRRDDSEAFRDDNENRTRQTTETFVDFDRDGTFDLGDGLYNGLLQGTAYAAAPKSKHVFSNSTLVMSTSGANITFSTAAIAAPGSYSVTVTDRNGNTMPSGTTVAIAVPFGTLSGATSYTVPLNVGFGVTLPFHVAASTTPRAQSGLVTVTVTSPGGLATIGTLPISGMF